MRIPWKSVRWTTSLFLIGTLTISCTVVPAYLWQNGLSWFQAMLFVTFFLATGLSITLGYHRLFSHNAFRARWPVRLFILLFGAAAFEHSVLEWSADHRRHHKFVDHEHDPYDITKGFLHAHIGWLLFRTKPPTFLDNVGDLQRDALVAWQHRHYMTIAFLMSFGLPAMLGLAWGGWHEALGCFLVAGVARVVFVQHMTFCINSLCHTLGRQPYSSRNTARDSAFMALLTFGEGYHNYHHEFQYDYRNGVKPWQFDPTKWSIWLLHKVGLVTQMRRVPAEKILLAEITETQRRLADQLIGRHADLPPVTRTLLVEAHERLQQAAKTWNQRKTEYVQAAEQKLADSRERIAALQAELELAAERLRHAIEQWREAHQLAQSQLA